jgi:NADH dehydrogenase
VVVGAGASGTELAAEIGGYIAELAKAHKKGRKKVHVSLIEGAPRVLPLLKPQVSKKALKKLRSRGVVVYTNKQVTAYKKGVLTFAGHKIGTETLVWTAGAKNNPLFSQFDKIFTLNERGKVVVDEYLAANKHIYVLGDNAATKYSGMAQTALFDAIFLARNLKRQLHGHAPYKYMPRKPIYLIPIGGKQALLQWGPLIISGYPAWVIRRISDFRLFREFEPLREAVRSWQAGNHRARNMHCDICDPSFDKKS